MANEMCGTCKYGGKITGYFKYRKNRKGVPLIYCDKFKKSVREDDLCLHYETLSGKRPWP